MPEPRPAPAESASVSVEDHGVAVVVRVAGEIDMLTEAVVGEPLSACLNAVPRAVVIDLSEVGFIGSTGLNLLVRARRQALRDGVTVRVVANTRAVRRPLEITGLTRYLPLCASVPEALRSIGAASDAATGR
ncbi:STAS domain-containing protein [Lentzea cavernae]|uniref:Anti-sigma factor antagonist n=1 Tax=Lentzea cavernae TaxID=2020703 RepID=A0ABQ3LW57_9PSEU|nr:STAS domain-containing protein [Lentzea cavernae]GHH27809.1 anti-sigma factor antagonist [Lentzea cavernae]